MSYYLTPLKQESRKNTKSTGQNKAQDWVCVVCNNLNFSFRKKCNRCKTQTRSQNQNHVVSAYSQYYYQQATYSHHHTKSPLSDATNLFTPQASKQNDGLSGQPFKLELDLSGKQGQKDLQTRLENQEDQAKKEHYMNQFWELINVKDFDQVLQTGLDDDEADAQEYGREGDEDWQARTQQRRISADLERMFQKILL